jgi:uncharacterized membrane protein
MNRTTGYWISTGLFCLAFVGGGLGHLFHADPMAEGMARLGYPAYVMSILGVAKLLGVAALLAPGQPTLKEWAYAGFAFDLIGAAASHLFAGDPIGEAVPPLVLLAIGAASYQLRPPERRLVAPPA